MASVDRFGPPLPQLWNWQTQWDLTRKKWFAHLENALIAADITADTRKKAQLLRGAGEDVFEIYSSILDGDTLSFAEVKRKLTADFQPKQNKEYEVFMFKSAHQEVKETVDNFVSNLRCLSKYCKFADTDAEIKSQSLQTCLAQSSREVF